MTLDATKVVITLQKTHLDLICDRLALKWSRSNKAEPANLIYGGSCFELSDDKIFIPCEPQLLTKIAKGDHLIHTDQRNDGNSGRFSRDILILIGSLIDLTEEKGWNFKIRQKRV